MGVVRKATVAIVIIAVLLAAAYFLSGGYQAKAIESRAKLGVSLPLTGAASYLGKWALEGVEIAKDEENFDIVVEDDECSGQEAVNVFSRLHLDGVAYVIGPLCNAASIPASGVAESGRIIMVTTGVSTKAIREAGNYSFTILPPIDYQTSKLAAHIESEGIDTVSVVYVKDEYGVENAQTFEEAFGGKIEVSEGFDRPENDFRSMLSKIKDDGSSAVVLIGYSPNFVNIINQMHELQISKRIFSVSNIQDQNIVNSTGNLTEGIVYTYPQISDSEKFRAFLKKYNKRYGKNQDILPMYVGAGYDAAKIVISAMKKCGEDAECAKDAILSVKNYKGVNGIISIDEKGNSQMPVELRTIKGGKFVRLEDYSAPIKHSGY